MEDATLIKTYIIGGKTTELRFTPKANTQTWPGYDDSLPLRYAGYWYGTNDRHEHIGKTEEEALGYLAGNYGIWYWGWNWRYRNNNNSSISLLESRN